MKYKFSLNLNHMGLNKNNIPTTTENIIDMQKIFVVLSLFKKQIIKQYIKQYCIFMEICMYIHVKSNIKNTHQVFIIYG